MLLQGANDDDGVRTLPEPSERARELLLCKSLEDLSRFFKISESTLRFYTYGAPEKRYIQTSVLKKNGKYREIFVPNGALKKIHRQLYPILEELAFYSHVCHGFRKKHSILTGASYHTNSSELLTIDIKDFFPTIHFGRIFGLFKAKPFAFSDRVARHLANLVCHQSKLPQGAPTSPVLANMICYQLDKDLWKLCGSLNVRYTRYADDLTFSVRKKYLPNAFVDQHGMAAKTICEKIENYGFNINHEKTRVKHVRDRQSVTGLVVNQKVNVDRRYINRIRGALNAWEKYGYDRANDKYIEKYRLRSSRNSSPSYHLKYSLRGRISFVGQIRSRTDAIYLQLLNRLGKLDRELLTHNEIIAILPLHHAREVVKNSIFVLTNINAEGAVDFGQGTAFKLKDVGFVSAAHCMKSGTALLCPHSTKEYAITNLRINVTHDIALFDVPDCIDAKDLFADSKNLTIDQQVTAIGFPNYSYGTTANFVPTKIAELRRISGIEFPLLAHGISPGKSGGPALGKNNKVVGICQRGEEEGGSSDFRIFPLKELRRLLEDSSLWTTPN